MFSKRHWKVLLLGCISFALTVGFSALGVWRHAQPSNAQPSGARLGGQATAIAQSKTAGNPSVDDLFNLLPPLEASEAARDDLTGEVLPGEAIAETQPLLKPQAVPKAEPKPTAPQQKAFQQKARSKYGHLPYAEANRNHLTVAGYYGSRSERLHVDAAAAYKQMIQAARRDGVGIIPVSGFRDTVVQADLFSAQTHRQGSAERAARISAPPGHSEHHTGYAIDLGDEGMPSTDVEVTFEQTPAFRWLAQHAGSYGFELSFPRGNDQNVTYEPWHWRFVGTLHARKVFAQAR